MRLKRELWLLKENNLFLGARNDRNSAISQQAPRNAVHRDFPSFSLCDMCVLS